MTIKTTVYRDVTPCSLVDKHQRFLRNLLPPFSGQESFLFNAVKELVAPKRRCLRIEPHCITFRKKVALKNTIFWNETPYILAEIYRRCEELSAYIFRIRINRTRKQKLGLSKIFSPRVTVALRWNCGRGSFLEIICNKRYNRTRSVVFRNEISRQLHGKY
jgi:hypothetical protein